MPAFSSVFLIDTGCVRSLLPVQPHEHTKPLASLVAANASTISTFGRRVVELQVGHRLLPWEFIVADVAQPLWVDFLVHHGFVINIIQL